MPLPSQYVSGSGSIYTGTGKIAADNTVALSTNYAGTMSREFGLTCTSSGPFDSFGRDCSGTVMWVTMNSPGSNGQMGLFVGWYDILYPLPHCLNLTHPIPPSFPSVQGVSNLTSSSTPGGLYSYPGNLTSATLSTLGGQNRTIGLYQETEYQCVAANKNTTSTARVVITLQGWLHHTCGLCTAILPSSSQLLVEHLLLHM